MDPESSLYILSVLAHQKYTISEGSFREIKHNTFVCFFVFFFCLFFFFFFFFFLFNKRSGAVVMSPDSEIFNAAVGAGVGSNLTQPIGISYFSLHTFF